MRHRTTLCLTALLLAVCNAGAQITINRRATPAGNDGGAVLETVRPVEQPILTLAPGAAPSLVVARAPGSWFTLTRQQPTFTFVFNPPEPRFYVAGVEWKIGGRLELAVNVEGETGSTVGESPQTMRIHPPAGTACTFTVSAVGPIPLQGIQGDFRVVKQPREGEGRSKSMREPAEQIQPPPLTTQLAILPLMANLAQRYLQGVEEKTDADAAFEQAAAHSGMTRAEIAAMVSDYDSIPDSQKLQLIAPGDLRLRAVAAPTLALLPQALPSVEGQGVATLAGPGLGVAVLQPAPAAGVAHSATGPPKIVRVEPGLLPGNAYVLGAQIALVGENFSPDLGKNSILIGNDLNTLAGAAPIRPSAGDATRLAFAIPKSLAPGLAFTMVRVVGAGESNARALQVAAPKQSSGGMGVLGKPAGSGSAQESKKPPAPEKPTFTQILPKPPHPGETLIIHGDHFATDADYRLVLSEQGSGKVKYELLVKARSGKELHSRVEQWVRPGVYEMWLALKGKQVCDRRHTLNIEPGRFSFTARDVYCVDESNPEWWGADEIVAYWVVAHDTMSYRVGSEIMEPFEDYTHKPFPTSYKNVLPSEYKSEGTGVEVRHGVALALMLWEWDAEQPQTGRNWTWLNRDFKGGTGRVNNEYAHPRAYGPVMSFAGSEPDLIGKWRAVWKVEDLQQMVPAGHTVTKEIRLHRGYVEADWDDTGNYTVKLDIRRLY